ncbi:hypothetical protein BYT27DRAFT_7200373 [Phlegmacium glaucopus]|nr:hypothetical protein BYT27DRAFT_7200373 [Phlegmacium glaucopus]
MGYTQYSPAETHVRVFETIEPFVKEIKECFPSMGARQLVTSLMQDYRMKLPEYVVCLLLSESVRKITIAQSFCAYVADFQGGATLLTDPQILTNGCVITHSINFFLLNHAFGELGYIFAEGNIPETFKSFETDHMYNNFCGLLLQLSDYEDCAVAT